MFRAITVVLISLILLIAVNHHRDIAAIARDIAQLLSPESSVESRDSGLVALAILAIALIVLVRVSLEHSWRMRRLEMDAGRFDRQEEEPGRE